MTKRQSDKVTKGLRYIGEGAFLPHVPARDLSAAEVEQYAVELSEAEAAGTLALLYVPIVAAASGEGANQGNGEVVNA